MSTKIEWTDETWNPVTGCTKVSPGCKNCYAERVADRFWGAQYAPIPKMRDGIMDERPRKFTDVQCHPERLDQPLRWRKPRRIFVCSMSDLFHEAVPDGFIDRVIATAACCPRHTFQILTKRAERMRKYMAAHDGNCLPVDYWPLPNVHLGVSAENQEMLDKRVPDLLATPAAKRVLSLEPLLGAVDLSGHGGAHCPGAKGLLDWVVVGGESGPGARPCHPWWIRDIVRQCKDAQVPVFVKQTGAWRPKLWGGTKPSWDGNWGTLDYEGHWHLETTPWNGHQLEDSDTGEVVMVRTLGKGNNPAEWPEDLRVRELPA